MGLKIIRTQVELETRVREGSKRYHELIMLSEIEPFFYNNQRLFAGRAVLDLGCGKAFSRRILRRPEFKAKYRGVDIDRVCNGSYPSKPDICADYRHGIRFEKESFDVLMALFPELEFTSEKNMAHVLGYLAKGGIFVHSGTPFCYKKHNLEWEISRHLSQVKIEQYITPVVCCEKEIYQHNNIFSVWVKN